MSENLPSPATNRVPINNECCKKMKKKGTAGKKKFSCVFQVLLEKSHLQRNSLLQLEDRRTVFRALFTNAQHPLDENNVAVFGCLPCGHHGVTRPRTLVEDKPLHALDLELARLRRISVQHDEHDSKWGKKARYAKTSSHLSSSRISTSTVHATTEELGS